MKLQLKIDVEKEVRIVRGCSFDLGACAQANAEAQALIDKLNFDLSNLRNRLK